MTHTTIPGKGSFPPEGVQATARPWRIQSRGIDRIYDVIVNESGEKRIASVGVSTVGIPESKANGQLIVAAVNSYDAMLGVLKALEPYLVTHNEMLNDASMNEGRVSGFALASMKARDAIAVAERHEGER